MKGYCFRCKGEREMEKTSEHRLKNGRKMLKGECKSCGCRMNKFL